MNSPDDAQKSNPPSFLQRDVCPICRREPDAALFDVPMDAGWTANYLTEYYAGRADLALLTGARYRLAACEACRLGWQIDAPVGALAQKLYTEWLDIEATRRREMNMSDSERRALASDAANVQRLIGLAPQEIKVLDYGVGWSRWAAPAAACGYQTFGTDLSEAKLQHAKSVGVRPLKEEAWESQRYHYIHCDQALEHLPNPRPTVERLAGALEPGGVLLLGTPNAAGALRHLANKGFPPPEMTPIHPLEHINAFTHHALERLGRAVGLSPIAGPAVGAGILRSRLRPIYRRFFSTRLLLRKPSA